MIFQKILKGVSGLSDQQAEDMLRQNGIICRWWERVGQITPPGIQDKLTEANLYWHLERYNDIHPDTGRPFHEDTPYISTTAGSVQRDAANTRNILFPPLMTALAFATRWFSQSGHIFYGYVYVLGKQSVPLMEFAEEVRELNIYTSWLKYHSEGEIVAKIIIPSSRLRRVERYDPQESLDSLRRGIRPAPAWCADNANFCPPEDYSNVRELLL